MADGDAAVERLIALMARLPGLGPRSARRAALALVRKRESLLSPLAAARPHPDPYAFLLFVHRYAGIPAVGS